MKELTAKKFMEAYEKLHGVGISKSTLIRRLNSDRRFSSKARYIKESKLWLIDPSCLKIKLEIENGKLKRGRPYKPEAAQ